MTTRRLLYVIGEPGVGKSTFMQSLTGHLHWDLAGDPILHETALGGRVVKLGNSQRESFPGTDAMPMDAVVRAERWIANATAELILGEGDRLANERFLNRAAFAAGYETHVVWLRDPYRKIVEARRARRAADLGRPPQNPTWVAGRVTHTRNLGIAFRAFSVDATKPLFVQVAQVRNAYPWLAILDQEGAPR